LCEAFFITLLWVVIDEDVSLTDHRLSSFGGLLLRGGVRKSLNFGLFWDLYQKQKVGGVSL
jgi:hypothetical protein